MADQIVLAWRVDVTNSSLGPAGAAAAMSQANVPLYTDPVTDPVLGQLFGLTVASDVSAADGLSHALRTLTLNMTTGGGSPVAPPPFPCHPRTSTPPVLPYPLRSTKALPGSFFVATGAVVIPTTMTQLPSVSAGDSVQFLSQEGVFYTVLSLTATALTLTTAYSGVAGNTEAFKEIAAPVKLAAIFSTSDLDTAGVATVPAIAAGSGARIVELLYNDSTGAGPFVAVVPLTGKRPAAVPLDPMSVDIAEILTMVLGSVGSFENSVGEITLVELLSALPALPPNLPLGTGIGAAETNVGKVGAPVPRTFKTMTDDAQMLITQALAYLPPSYFALAQQGASTPQLAGDFSLTTGETSVPTTVDQTGALAPGGIIRFAEQFHIQYTVATVTPKYVTLTTPFSGVDNNNTGTNQLGTNADAGTMGNVGEKLNKKWSGAFLVSPSAALPPTAAQLAGPMGQFVALETAAPPLNPPLNPSTVPVPTFLSGMFTRQLQLAIAGVPVVPQAIAFV